VRLNLSEQKLAKIFLPHGREFMRTVLVTRPEPGATKTALKFSAFGFDPIVLPLTKTLALAYSISAEHFDAILISSSQAVQALPRFLPESFLATPLYAVGAASGKAAALAGFLNVSVENGNAEALITNVINNVAVGSSLLYLCGKVRRPDIELALQVAGYRLTAVETYDTLPVVYDEEALCTLPTGGHIDMVLVTSVQSALELNKLALLNQSQFLCLSRRIADALFGTAPDLIHVADEPNETSLLNLAMRVAKLGSAL
jgi:uroporphyrinogen-III synthase